MAYTTIDDPSAFFQTTTYTGTGSSGNAITNSGNSDLKPDWLWIKSRSDTEQHTMWDSSRGSTKRLMPDANNAEFVNSTQGVQSFDTDGFTTGDSDQYNKSSQSCVAWQWKANGGTTSSNSDGNITSTVQANTTAGFSIVTFTGNGNNDATIGHGLGTTPAMIITKNRDDAVLWRVWHQSLTSTNVLFLNEDFAQTAPSGHSNGYIKTVGSSTYSVYQGNSDTNGVNGSSDDMIAYCFAEKQGYSKFGSYTGNGASSDGPFVYTGFKPAFFLIKSIGAARFWHILDNKRNTINPVNLYLNPNNSDADGTFVFGDFLSNGFKITNLGNTFNTNGETYIYMAFAEHPFVSSKGVPVTAR
jgi:hypothetical protein